jgi:hypothetical protein
VAISYSGDCITFFVVILNPPSSISSSTPFSSFFSFSRFVIKSISVISPHSTFTLGYHHHFLLYYQSLAAMLLSALAPTLFFCYQPFASLPLPTLTSVTTVPLMVRDRSMVVGRVVLLILPSTFHPLSRHGRASSRPV